ncbi:nicotinate-nucleotide adenylyltransferase [secondary endosymbiont of Ctenarytaina eucalypti]|uniref:Probable nicotinate-nucleotide adenylyltransferase n=1 Tax=secondary endosymbiont of Ctenarytaina eucalypti TaxID=1199245 RepID=J3Z3V5_9ENTR|nr:nicotinate-nucleotide adenylyltransferase [secondary endosymbiont of Ctenarytaina eucalypti]AFP84904.1 nicotinate/nicotinamide nucleotide adenylyltransferase [secondary endosymbiont of Ctenarytaina eucalypti]
MTNGTLRAFYGGTFDPIHYGHLLPVIALARLVNLQKVILLPNHVPPHRPQPVASAYQRLSMARLAIAELPGTLFSLDDREIRRPIPSWTVDTFEDLRGEYGPNATLGFIIGEDSLQTLPQWHRGLALLDLCHILVCLRPHHNDLMNSGEGDNYWLTSRLTRNPQALYQQPSGMIYCPSTPIFSISASDIRARYRQGRACDGLLPSSVCLYIHEQGLYR